jgi:autotransporter family porin
MFRQNVKRLGVVPGTPPCVTVSGPPVAMKFFTLTPCRILDTRNPNGPYGGPALLAQSTRFFIIAGQCGIPADGKVVSLNLTVVNATALGDLRLFPGSSAPPLAATINFRAGQVRANNATVGLSATGVLSVLDDQPIGSVDIIMDTNGYYK